MSPASVSPALDRLGRLAGEHPRFWIAAGNLESRLLPELESIAVEKPIYIAGLARAGSTKLLEILAAQPGVATHRYRDFPFVMTPYIWNTLLKFFPSSQPPRERAHGDRIMVNADSPEAMEEMLWMAFFPQLRRGAPEIFDAQTSHPAFERFYREHIKKLLLARKGSHYAAKNNYNLTRLAYLHRIFPNARFVIPVREPAAHIASLMRQHERFSAIGAREARHMRLAGHFEFGVNRTPIHVGNETLFSEIENTWRNGDEISGWALYWDMLHRFLRRKLEESPSLRGQALIVRFEDLCAKPEETVQALLEHCRLPRDEAVITRLAASVSAPDYYRSPIAAADLARIREITGETAGWLGY